MGRRRPVRRLRARTASWARIWTVADCDGGRASVPPGIAAVRARNIHGLYDRHGFRPPARSESHKELHRPDIHARATKQAEPLHGLETQLVGDLRGSRRRLQRSRALFARTRLARSRVVGLPMYVVHAFTDRPFAGNPAAVCSPPAPPSDGWMQQVAAEMRLPETAFVTPADDGYELRWFTPAVEVALCGHATLAAALVLWETGRLRPGDQARFQTHSGLLTVNQGSAGMTMDFPARAAELCPEWDELPAILGAQARFIGRNGMDALVELEDEPTIRCRLPERSLLSQ